MTKLLSFLFFLCSIHLAYATGTHNPQDQINQAKISKDPGGVIYRAFCSNCHAEKPLIPLGAPRLHNTQEWQARANKGLTSMLDNLAKGINAMPARGGCFECDDLLLKQATIYLLPTSLSKKLLKQDK